jgi:hypothetical protein
LSHKLTGQTIKALPMLEVSLVVVKNSGQTTE